MSAATCTMAILLTEPEPKYFGGLAVKVHVPISGMVPSQQVR